MRRVALRCPVRRRGLYRGHTARVVGILLAVYLCVLVRTHITSTGNPTVGYHGNQEEVDVWDIPKGEEIEVVGDDLVRPVYRSAATIPTTPTKPNESLPMMHQNAVNSSQPVRNVTGGLPHTTPPPHKAERDASRPAFIYTYNYGRFGNHLFQFASAYSLARATNRTLVIEDNAWNTLSEYFSRLEVHHLDMPESLGVLQVIEDNAGVYQPDLMAEVPPTGDLELCCFLQSWRYFEDYESEIRKQLRFHTRLLFETREIIDAMIRYHYRQLRSLQARKHKHSATMRPNHPLPTIRPDKMLGNSSVLGNSSMLSNNPVLSNSETLNNSSMLGKNTVLSNRTELSDSQNITLNTNNTLRPANLLSNSRNLHQQKRSFGNNFTPSVLNISSKDISSTTSKNFVPSNLSAIVNSSARSQHREQSPRDKSSRHSAKANGDEALTDQRKSQQKVNNAQSTLVSQDNVTVVNKIVRQNQNLLQNKTNKISQGKETSVNHTVIPDAHRGDSHHRGYTYIGVHVRREDVTGQKELERGYKPAPASYFHSAMDYFRDRYDNALFLVVSDDPSWAQAKLVRSALGVRLMDVVVATEPRHTDFSLLAMCNHTIISVGTYGWWAAWLAGGTVVYYSNWPTPDTEIGMEYKAEDYFPPHWVGLGD